MLIFRIIRLIFVVSSLTTTVDAFVTPQWTTGRKNSPQASGQLRLDSGNSLGDLTNTLARIDRQWKIQQQMKPRSRWQTITLPTTQDPAAMGTTSSTVYVLKPPENTQPSCLIVFLGGAGLGLFPHIAYNELLLRISNKLNAAIVAAPYQVNLDHFTLSKQVGELARRAVLHLEDDPLYNYPSSLPTYCLTHSLGGKLATIYSAATGLEYEGVGMMAFNNFGFSQTIGMAKEFAKQIQGDNKADSTTEAMDQLFNLAESFLGTINLDFTPSPLELQRMISMKYDPYRQQKTRMFMFDDDKLDSTISFLEACRDGPGPSISALQGGHLSPVYFRFGLDELPEETRDVARVAMGQNSIDSFSFGNENELNAVVEEVCGWIMGRAHSRLPDWLRERQQLKPGDDNSVSNES